MCVHICKEADQGGISLHKPKQQAPSNRMSLHPISEREKMTAAWAESYACTIRIVMSCKNHECTEIEDVQF